MDAIKIVDDIKSNEKSQVCDINMIDKDEQTKNRRKNRKPWSNYEDMRLLIGIMRFGINNWKSISLFVGNNRSSSQCSQRWNRSLNPCISKNIWSAEENFQLLNLVQQYGERAWSKISKIMQNRSDIQCQYHYKQIKGKIAYHSLDQNSISNLNTGFQNYFECDSQKVDLKEKKLIVK